MKPRPMLTLLALGLTLVLSFIAAAVFAMFLGPRFGLGPATAAGSPRR